MKIKFAPLFMLAAWTLAATQVQADSLVDGDAEAVGAVGLAGDNGPTRLVGLSSIHE